MKRRLLSRFGVVAGIVLTLMTASALPAADPIPDQAIDPASYDHPVRVACVGDSITMGVGTLDPATQSYPNQLQTILGSGWEVKTFAAGGRTLLRKQDPMDHHRAMKYQPDVVIIMLGTNDARQATWDKHGAEFVSDYQGIIKDFLGIATHPKVWLCLPVPAFPEHWGISEKLIAGTVIPAIQEAATGSRVPTIDLHTPLADKKAWFPDAVHPNKDGAHRIAELVAAAISKTAAPASAPSSTKPANP